MIVMILLQKIHTSLPLLFLM